MFSLPILAQGGVFESVRQSLPTDPAALFTLALCALAIVAVVVGGRKGKGKGKGPDGAA